MVVAPSAARVSVVAEMPVKSRHLIPEAKKIGGNRINVSKGQTRLERLLNKNQSKKS